MGWIAVVLRLEWATQRHYKVIGKLNRSYHLLEQRFVTSSSAGKEALQITILLDVRSITAAPEMEVYPKEYKMGNAI